MRYALLDALACQACHSELACFTYREKPSEIPAGPYGSGTRVGIGPGLGPLPQHVGSRERFARLHTFAGAAGDPARNFAVEIDEGVLLCPGCGRWYPITHRLPEILPDHLRDFDADAARLRDAAAAMPPELAKEAFAFRPAPSGAATHTDSGAHHKHAEMSIKEKIDDPAFFGPGYSSPFNPWNPEFTLYLIALYGSVLKLLELKKGETLLDSGCGYAWTTEWFHRAGVPVVGVDISRVYLDIAIERMGDAHPPLVIGDVENLPFKNGAFDAVLAYESFHHIPDRPRALKGYDRVLNATGRVVLAEPGAAHEHAEVSVDVMKKYGILERGMELEDVTGYASGSALTGVEQVFLARTTQDDLGRGIDRALLKERSLFEGNLFRLRKSGVASSVTRIGAPRRRLWPVAKRHIKRALLKVGLD
jgi:SAM-dependent methyltransferase/uncharacterized protein YbaR (Trm112 family)